LFCDDVCSGDYEMIRMVAAPKVRFAPLLFSEVYEMRKCVKLNKTI